ncbi:SMC5-SMC6 complex localization factor protein 2 isoform X2 [Anoplopoma fimbria]|uniref:SMC5-SMC6 complex localization factor protein 2 isoform X2 n=1 Tax=Anoplopoma fimbria TaxID=229290 RepID=UPI0023ED6FC4|nr:SMC5-SMC6 complex localization factor protein 2 isoform X2 [Anoplopoma fimbria]
MRRATENQRKPQTLSEYFPPRNKVKDLGFQQSRPHFRPFLPETPMKPSQLPNRLSHPPPRRMLPLQSPELCHRDRLGPPQHPFPPPHLIHPAGPIHSPGFVPSNPTHIGSPVNGSHPMAGVRLAPLQHQNHQPPGSLCSSRSTPVSPTNSGTTAIRPQPQPQPQPQPPPPPPGIFHPASPQFMKDLSNHSPSSHIRGDQGTESKVTMSYSGSKNVMPQRQAPSKDQSSDVSSSIHTIQLHRPPITQSFYTRGVQEGHPLPLSDAEHWITGNNQWSSWGYQPSPITPSADRSSGSSVPAMHNPVVPCQDQQHKHTPSSENLIPAVDLNYTSQKRQREIEDHDDNPKKLCLSDTNSGKAQSPKPTVGNSLSPSQQSQPSARHPSVLEQLPKTTNSLLCTEPACGQSTCSELPSTYTPTQSSCASPSFKPCVKNRPPMGAKQAYINSSQNQILKLIELRSPSKNTGEESLKKRSKENDKRDKPSSLFSSELPQKDTGSSPYVQSGSHHSGHTQQSTSDLPVKTLSRGDPMEESRKTDSSTPKPSPKANSASLSCRLVERNKTARPRKPVAVPNDIDELFTPDPMTYVVSSGHKTAKPKMLGIKSPTSEKSCSSSTVTSSSAPVYESSCHTTTSPHAVDSKVSSLSSAHHAQVTLPTVALERVKLENFKSICSKDGEFKHSSITSSGRRRESFDCSHSPLPERRTSEGPGKPVIEEDPIDVELDLGLSFALDLDLTQSSQSSEEEQLLSLQEMMDRVTKPPATPEKIAFSEPSTPGHHSSQSKTPLPTTKSGIYKNNLDQMLKEINTNKRAKEIETQLLTACKEDLLRIAEYEEAEENREEGVSTEQQEFLQRYSLMSNAIREVPPGEAVFNLEKFGQIFNQDTLQLRRCMVNPQGTAQKTLLWSSPAQLRLHVNIGLFQEAYDCRTPCPAQVTRFLFKMMSVHSERLVSEKILQALCDIACTSAYQIVKNGNQHFKVWVPSLADVALVVMNMGVAFITLFPFENLQPPFNEGDLLEDIFIKSESPSSNKEQNTFPEHNCNNILKYLSYCMGLCPRVYSDDELLLLLTMVGKVGLDTRLILQSSVELYPLQYKIVNNFRDWNTMLPRICLALTDLTDDHHNMCLLVQLLPDNTRGKQLRRHLSLSMISKLLDGNCTYRPTEKEFQLSELRPYLPRMQPSTILRGMMSSFSRSQKDKEEDTLDQQSYYLCYSLLTLANEASNFQFFPAHQKKQLLSLCSELETHVKCDIRESEKCLYRSKVKDLVARIYTKWQMLLQRTRPLHGKLYDYWQPVDTLTSSQEEQEMDNSDDGEGPVMEEDEDEGTFETEEDLTIAEEEEVREEGDDTMDYTNEKGDDVKTEEKVEDDTTDETNKTGDNVKPEDMEADNAMDDTNETGDNMKPEEMEADHAMDDTHRELNLQMEPKAHEQIEAGNMKLTEVETENLVDTRETSNQNQVAAGDLVS